MYSRALGKNAPDIRSRWTRSIITASASGSTASMSYDVSKPAAADHAPIPLGISVGGATTVTRAPSLVRHWTLERKTRLWVRSPMIATWRPSSEPRRRCSV